MNRMKNKGMIQSNEDAHAGPTGTGKVFQKRKTLAESPRRSEIELKIVGWTPAELEDFRTTPEEIRMQLRTSQSVMCDRVIRSAIVQSRFGQLEAGLDSGLGTHNLPATHNLFRLLRNLVSQVHETGELLLAVQLKVRDKCGLDPETHRNINIMWAGLEKMKATLRNLLVPDEPELLDFRLQLAGIDKMDEQKLKNLQIDAMDCLCIEKIWLPTEGRILAIERNIPEIERVIAPFLSSSSLTRTMMELTGENIHIEIGSEIARRIERIKRAQGGFLDTVDTLNEWEANDPVKQWERKHPELAQKLAEKILISERPHKALGARESETGTKAGRENLD